MEDRNNSEFKLEIEQVPISFENVYQKENIPLEYLENIKRANILLLPYDKFWDEEEGLFPEETYDFYEYIKNKAEKENLIVDVVVSDDDYKEIEMHSELIRLPMMLVQYIGVPMLVNFISNYVYDKVKKRKSDLQVNIFVEKDGHTKKVTYEGNIENFERVMETIKESNF